MVTQESLIERINALPPTKLSAVAEFVDSITERPSAEEQHRLIADYAAEFGGTRFDLDPDLERAGLEALAAIDGANE